MDRARVHAGRPRDVAGGEERGGHALGRFGELQHGPWGSCGPGRGRARRGFAPWLVCFFFSRVIATMGDGDGHCWSNVSSWGQEVRL